MESRIFTISLFVIVLLFGSNKSFAADDEKRSAETNLVHDNKTAQRLSAFTWKSFESIDDDHINLLEWIQKNPTPVSREPQPYRRRDHFGGGWIRQEKGNCQNTRAAVLIRDSQVPVEFSDDKKCTVTKGKWYDPYTDKEYTSAQDLDVDHFVPLKHAYLAGAFRWDGHRRCHYANFMESENHLKAASDAANSQKSDNSPDEWIPENEDYVCEYLGEWLKIKAIWELNMAKEELSQIQNYIEKYNCDQKVFNINVKELHKLQKDSHEPIAACE